MDVAAVIVDLEEATPANGDWGCVGCETVFSRWEPEDEHFRRCQKAQALAEVQRQIRERSAQEEDV